MANNKKFITIYINKAVINEFKLLIEKLNMCNQSKLIEKLMKEWIEKNKEKSVKSN